MKSIKLYDRIKSVFPLCSVRFQMSTGDMNLLLLAQCSMFPSFIDFSTQLVSEFEMSRNIVVVILKSEKLY